MAQTDRTIVDLVLPTDNDALFSGDGPAFYQYIERNYKGVQSTPWEGGQYGFVRDPKDTAAGIVYTRFHEGIDIKPVQRDGNGEPLDQVRAIAGGKIVHTNLVPRHSNYGCYVVIEHRWAGSNYYSLYGHLSTISVKPGQAVHKGQPIAVMGYTGKGINRERAHVQDPVEQVLRQPGLREQVPAEPGERRMVRDQPPARDPERRVIPAPVLHRPGGQHPAQVGVHPHGQQHHRVIPGRAGRRPLRSRRHQPDGEVPRHELLDRVDNDPDSMALRYPVEHVMGQKHLGITVNRPELVCHKPILPAKTPENRETQICNSPPGACCSFL